MTGLAIGKFPNDEKKQRTLLRGIFDRIFSLVGQRPITGRKAGWKN